MAKKAVKKKTVKTVRGKTDQVGSGSFTWSLGKFKMEETAASKKKNESQGYWLERTELNQGIAEHLNDQVYPSVTFHYGPEYTAPVDLRIPDTRGPVFIGCMEFSAADGVKLLRWAESLTHMKRKKAA